MANDIFMPAKSQAQRALLNAKFGHGWVKKHHFDNPGRLPKHAARGVVEAFSSGNGGDRSPDTRVFTCPQCGDPLDRSTLHDVYDAGQLAGDAFVCAKCGDIDSSKIHAPVRPAVPYRYTRESLGARSMFERDRQPLAEFQPHLSCPTCNVPLKEVSTLLKCPQCGYGKNVPVTRQGFTEGRDDTAKLPLGKAGHAFASVTSKDVMHQPGGTSNLWRKSLAQRKEIVNQKHVSDGKGSTTFPSMDKVGKVPSAIKDSVTPAQVVSALLETSS